MSEPQLISPLLDGFVMGDPISSHYGVRACPAMQLETDKKHIVKIISLPADQSKLDALLLAGAFSDKESALTYFKELSDDILEEAALLQKLARNEGFVSFEKWQMVPMENDETGYDIYLLGEYRPTLEGVLRTNQMTHLQAINLGLDLCAALSVSRRCGYLYSNLRPSNVFICNEREFRIGDLGFLSLDSLQYASLPDKYRSDYTPPEISDAYSALNTTMDTYAAGLILYQAYNDGRLPPLGMQPLPPRHADAALSEIILKACSVNPEDRWQDPVQMGQAIANYMQTNTVNDTPIVPPAPVEEIPEPEPIIEVIDDEPSTEDILAEVDDALEAAPVIVASDAAAEVITAVEEAVDETVVEEIQAVDAAKQAEDLSVEEAIAAEVAQFAADEEAISAQEAQIPAEEDTPVATDPAAESAEDEVSQILAEADDLIAYQLPEPPVAPAPIDVNLPVEDVAEEAVAEDITATEDGTEETVEPEEAVIVPEEIPQEPEATEEVADEIIEEHTEKRKSSKRLAIIAIILALILMFAAATAVYYQNSYLQTVDDMILSGSDDTLTVTVIGDIDTNKLFVTCTDIHGNSQTARMINGVATFTALKPGTYDVELGMDGMHELRGDIKETYRVSPNLVINGFYASEGIDAGSVILRFTVQGPDTTDWFVTFSTEGEEEKTMAFSGHEVTLSGLTIGKEYSFTLTPKSSVAVTGTNTITYTATGPVIKDIVFDDSESEYLKVSWKSNGLLPDGGWLLTYTVDWSEEKTIVCEGNNGEIPVEIPGAHYEISITPADGSVVFGGTATYDAPKANPFEGFLVSADDMEFKMCKTPNKADWDYRDVPESDYTASFAPGVSAAFVGHLSKKTSKVDDLVTTLYVIRDLDGKLVSFGSETRTWDEMWDDRYGEFVIPNMPTEIGHYFVEIYFDGASVYSQRFTIPLNG